MVINEIIVLFSKYGVKIPKLESLFKSGTYKLTQEDIEELDIDFKDYNLQLSIKGIGRTSTELWTEFMSYKVNSDIIASSVANKIGLSTEKFKHDRGLMQSIIFEIANEMLPHKTFKDQGFFSKVILEKAGSVADKNRYKYESKDSHKGTYRHQISSGEIGSVFVSGEEDFFDVKMQRDENIKILKELNGVPFKKLIKQLNDVDVLLAFDSRTSNSNYSFWAGFLNALAESEMKDIIEQVKDVMTIKFENISSESTARKFGKYDEMMRILVGYMTETISKDNIELVAGICLRFLVTQSNSQASFFVKGTSIPKDIKGWLGNYDSNHILSNTADYEKFTIFIRGILALQKILKSLREAGISPFTISSRTFSFENPATKFNSLYDMVVSNRKYCELRSKYNLLDSFISTTDSALYLKLANVVDLGYAGLSLPNSIRFIGDVVDTRWGSADRIWNSLNIKLELKDFDSGVYREDDVMVSLYDILMCFKLDIHPLCSVCLCSNDKIEYYEYDLEKFYRDYVGDVDASFDDDIDDGKELGIIYADLLDNFPNTYTNEEDSKYESQNYIHYNNVESTEVYHPVLSEYKRRGDFRGQETTKLVNEVKGTSSNRCEPLEFIFYDLYGVDKEDKSMKGLDTVTAVMNIVKIFKYVIDRLNPTKNLEVLKYLSAIEVSTLCVSEGWHNLLSDIDEQEEDESKLNSIFCFRMFDSLLADDAIDEDIRINYESDYIDEISYNEFFDSSFNSGVLESLKKKLKAEVTELRNVVSKTGITLENLCEETYNTPVISDSIFNSLKLGTLNVDADKSKRFLVWLDKNNYARCKDSFVRTSDNKYVIKSFGTRIGYLTIHGYYIVDKNIIKEWSDRD